jgi:hypothetical protein
MKKLFTWNTSHLFFILFLSACVAPDTSKLSPEEKDLYVTNRDMSVSFANYHTYAIVDSVSIISRSKNDSLKSKYNTQILSDVNLQMQKDGFVLVGKSQNPDVGLNVSVLKFSDKTPASYFDFTNSSSGYLRYPAPISWGYDYEYLFPSNFQYDQIDNGSIAIEMIDLKNASANTQHKLNVIWSALISGTVSDTTLTNPGRVESAIENSFNQSPYLKEGK